MALKDLFSRKKKDRIDPISDLTLPNMKAGYFVDYDMQTYSVEACHHYDWGSGDITYEWQLAGPEDTFFLERETDDEDHWSLSKKIPFGKLDGDIRSHITEKGDPPDQIRFEGTTYFLDEMGGGQFYKNREAPGKDVLKWDYTDDAGEAYLTIEQWGESEFEAAVGHPVYEYQFDHILPPGDDTV